jgi:hypothetical protein
LRVPRDGYPGDFLIHAAVPSPDPPADPGKRRSLSSTSAVALAVRSRLDHQTVAPIFADRDFRPLVPGSPF